MKQKWKWMVGAFFAQKGFVDMITADVNKMNA